LGESGHFVFFRVEIANEGLRRNFGDFTLAGWRWGFGQGVLVTGFD
jgi:hypothetical protein